MVLSHRYFRILVNSNGIFLFGFVLYSFLPTSSDIIWHFRSKISHLIDFIWCVGYLHSSLWNWANNMHLTEAIKLLIKICIVNTLPPKQSPHWLLSMAILAQSPSLGVHLWESISLEADSPRSFTRALNAKTSLRICFWLGREAYGHSVSYQHMPSISISQLCFHTPFLMCFPLYSSTLRFSWHSTASQFPSCNFTSSSYISCPEQPGILADFCISPLDLFMGVWD